MNKTFCKYFAVIMLHSLGQCCCVPMLSLPVKSLAVAMVGVTCIEIRISNRIIQLGLSDYGKSSSVLLQPD